MRWSNLEAEAEESRRLPGYKEPAAVRTFDAPEALDVRFYEVQAKSVLNRVPKASRMPFRWTVNPYRGCTHSCVYCLHGDTRILMADGGTKPIAGLEAGELICGTACEGAQRRLVPTDVHAHWSTVRPAFRVSLEDSTELVASGDHRFLTERGWMRVAADSRGRLPHLVAGDELVGVPFEMGHYDPQRTAPPGSGVGLLGTAVADHPIAERAVEARPGLRVASIEALGDELPLYDITTGTGDFIANGVVSHNCFARPTHTYLDFNARRDFEREIVVKVNAPEVLRAELTRPKWTREHVALGTNTDPYQWVEGRYRLMPGIWEAMRDSRTPCSVLTKSPLLLRDLELMKQIPGFAANLSVPTIDEKVWRQTEPHTPSPYARLEAVAELNRSGIPTGILIAPLIPGVNDQPEQVERIIELATEAGAVDIGGICLHLRGEVRDIWFDWLREYRPDLIPRYEQLYARGAYAPTAERERISKLIRSGSRVGPRPDPAAGPAVEPETPEPEQRRLF